MTGRETNISPTGLAILASPPPHAASASGMTEAQTLIDKLWAAHEIVRREDGDSLLWVDRHYVHEGSFHAFSRLAERGAPVAEPGLTFGVADHYVPTRAPRDEIGNPEIARMVRQMDENAAKHRIKLFGLNDRRQGIVHVVGPEQGLTLPGLLIVCGDSHTSTHGALGAFAFGIGASEVAHVLMTQTIWQRRPKRMRITVDGKTAPGIGAKDIVLAIIAKIGADGATGHAIEFAGSAIRALSIEGRLTLCNMSIEAGARCGMVAPDRVTFEYVEGPALRTKRDGIRSGGRGLVQAQDRRRRRIRSRGCARCHRDRADRHLGDEPATRFADRCQRAGSGGRGKSGARQRAARSHRLYGPASGPKARGDCDRSRFHRVLHQCADRGFARGGCGARRPHQQGAGTGVARLVDGQAPGRGQKGSTASSATPAWNGANPAVRCASASTATSLRPASAAPRPPIAIFAAGKVPARAPI